MFKLPENRLTYFTFAIIMASLAAVSFGSLSEHLFDTDDQEWSNELLTSLENPSYYFFSNRIFSVRPPVDLVYFASYFLSDNNPAAYHVIQILLHLAAFSDMRQFYFWNLGRNFFYRLEQLWQSFFLFNSPPK